MAEATLASALAMLTASCLLAFWIAPGGVLALRRHGGALQVDVRLAYRVDTLYGLLERYGPYGRRMFRRMLLADMFFPALYGATLFLLGDMLGSSIACSSAIAAVAFDYGENACLLHAVRHWKSRPYPSGRLASIFTSLKMGALGLTVASLAIARVS